MPGKYRRIRARALAALASVVLLVVIAACSSGTASGGGPTSLASGIAFYKGKTITLLVPSAPGGGVDAYARVLAPYLGKELDATVKVSNVPAANGIVAANELGTASPNGLTIGVVNLSVIVTAMLSNKSPSSEGGGLSYNWNTLDWIAGKTPSPDAVAVLSSSPYKTFSQLLDSKQQIKVLELTAGTGTLNTNAIVEGYGLNAKVITGYAASADLITGLLRGDGELVVTEISGSLGGAIREGKVRPLAMTTADSPGDSTYPYVKNLPTFAQLLADTPPSNAANKQLFEDVINYLSLINAWAAPPKTNAGEVAALVNAMKVVYAEPAVQAALAKNAFPTTYVGPAQTKQFVAEAYQKGEPLTKWLQPVS